MRGHVSGLLVALAVLGTACAGGQSLSPGHAAAMRDSVHTALADLQRYSSSSQWDSMAALYDGDSGFRWVEEGKIVSHSAREISAKLNSFPAGMKVETEFTGLDIAPVAPGVASVVTGFQTSLVDASGGKVSFGGTLTMVLVHRTAGWRILTGHSSAPRPVGAGSS